MAQNSPSPPNQPIIKLARFISLIGYRCFSFFRDSQFIRKVYIEVGLKG